MRLFPIKQPLVSFLLLTCSIATAYLLLAQAGLLTAITHNHAAIFWPPAGLAVASIILFGRRTTLGIFLGAFISEFFLFLSDLSLPSAVQLALTISVGVTLQALAAGLLFNRWVKIPPYTLHGRRFLKFLGVTAVGCMIGASVATVSLHSSGILAIENVGFHWGTWWIGDWFGILAFTPLFIVIRFSIQKRSFTEQAPMVTICVGLILSLFIFMLLWQGETQRIAAEFSANAAEVDAVIAKALQFSENSLDLFAVFVTHHEHVSRTDFQNFIAKGLSKPLRSTGIQSIQWVPYVRGEERAGYEALAHQDGYPDFHFTEKNNIGELIPAADRPAYFPIFYREAITPNETILGLDLGTNTAWKAALQKALLSRTFVVSDSLPLLDEEPGQKNVVILRPIFREEYPVKDETPSEAHLLGFVVTVYRLSNWIETLITPPSARGRDVYLLDPTQPEGQQLLFFRPSQFSEQPTVLRPNTTLTSLQEGIYYASNFTYGDQTWLMIIRPAPGWVNQRRSWVPWMALVIGISITAWLATRQFYQLRVALMEMENQDRMMLALENAQLGYWNFDPASGRTICSSGFETIFGVPSGSFQTYIDIYQRLHPEDAERLSQAFNALFQGGKAFPDFEGRLIRPDGAVRWVTSHGIVYQDAAGKTIQIVGVIHDITERKVYEEQIRESEARYRKLVELSPDAIFIETGGKWVFTNEAGLKLVEATQPEDILGAPYLDIVSPDGKAAVQEWLIKVHAGETTAPHFDGKIVKLNGTEANVEVAATSFSYCGQAGTLFIGHDITDRKRAESALRFQAEQLANVRDAIIATDMSGLITSWNKGAEEIYGWSAAEVMGRQIGEVLQTQYQSINREITEQSVYGAGDFQGEVKQRRKDGIWLMIEIRVRLMIGIDGQVSGFVGVNRDITERKQAEEQIFRQKEMLQTIIDHIPVMIRHAKSDGTVNLVNRTWEQTLGWTLAEIQRQNLDIIPLLYPDLQNRRRVEDLIASAQSQWIDFKTTIRDGQIIDTSWMVSRLSDESVIAIGQDITERKRAERELRESEERYRTLIENSHDLIVSLDKNGRILLANNTFLNTFAWDRQTVRNQTIFDFLYPEHRLEYQRLFAQYLSVGEPRHPILAEVITHDGRRVELEGTLTEQVMGDQVISIDGFFRDVTEDRKTEQIETVQSRVTRILADSPDITDALSQVIEIIANRLNWQTAEIWWLDPETNCLYLKTGWHEPKQEYDALEQASRSMQITYGTGIPGRTWQAGHALWSKHQAEDVFLHASLLEAANLQASLSIPMYHDQDLLGVMVFFSRFVLPLDPRILGVLDDLGRQIGQFVARKQAEQSLAQAEEIYRVLFEEAPVMYIISRDDTGSPVIQNCNNLFLANLGYHRDEVIGRPLGDFYTPDSKEKMHNSGYRLALAGQYSVQERELVRHDGTIIQVLHHALPELSRQGKVQGVRSMFVDITDRKRMEQAIEAERALLAHRVEERTAELRILNAELQYANRAKNEFLANTSHELRTPLNGILSFAEILLENVYGPLNERQMKAIQTMQGSGQHLLELINDILDLSKIEAGKLELHKEMTAVEQVCQASLRIIKEIAFKKQLQVVYFNPLPDLLFEVDSRRLKQILVNLLSNAIKFTPPSGKIQLIVEPQLNTDNVHISVVDSGIGIAEEDQKHLFQSFVQIDGSLTRSQEGTRLGLVLVRKLVDLHGGSVSLQSSPGEGSQFTISLPCYCMIPALPTEDHFEVEAQKKQDPRIEPKAKILLAEDNEVNAMAVGEYLQVLGYEISMAQNGQEAIDRTVTWVPDVILMDIQMPIMDGLEAIHHLRADPRFVKTPIIALTALAMVGDRERCLKNGATEYLCKPASLKGLVKLIEDLLQKAREQN